MGERGAIAWHVLSGSERERIETALESVLSRRARVHAAYLYGSAAQRGRLARDIDIGLLGSSGANALFVEEEIAAELERETGIRAIPFDVRLLHGGDPRFLLQVLPRDRGPGAAWRKLTETVSSSVDCSNEACR